MIGVLIFPDFQLLDAAGPISVFEIAARFAGLSPSIKVVAATPGPVRSSSGVEMLARGLGPSRRDHDADRGRRRWGATRRRHATKTLAFVRAMAKRGVRVASVCSGAYHACRSRPARWPPRHHALAAHPAISRRYPKVKREPDRIFVRDGNIWSSAGITAGIDLALAMVGGGFRRGDRAKDRAPARALSPPQRRPVAILLAAGIEGARAGASGRC